MKRILFIALALLAMASSAWATQITISSYQITQLPFNPQNLPPAQNFTVNVTNSSTTVTIPSQPLLLPNVVGVAGFQVTIGGVQYVVAGIPSTSSLTLTTPYTGSTGSATMRFHSYVLLRTYATASFQTSDGQNVQVSTPGSGNFYKQVAVSIINSGSGNVAYIPSFILPSTTDATINNQAKYVFGFYTPSNTPIAIYICGASTQQLSLSALTNPTTWTAICTFNAPGGIVPPNTTVYSVPEIDARFPGCVAGQSYYFASDGQKVSCLTYGSGLTLVGNVLSSSAAAGLMTRQAINVKTDYGCVGDGVTNDTTCLDNAVAAAVAATGKIVYVPAGTYLRTGTWTIPGGVTVEGDGKQKSIIKSASNAVIVDLVAGSGAYLFYGAEIRNLGVLGSKTAGSLQIGIRADASPYQRDVVVKDVEIRNAGSHGLYVGNSFSSSFIRISSDDNAGYPFLILAPNMPSNRFEELYAGTLNAGGNAGYRIRQGSFYCYTCNGINASAAGSAWAVVGDAIGVDGAASNVAAYAKWEDCNIESWLLYGVRHYSGSRSEFAGNNVFSGDASASGSAIAILYDNPSVTPWSDGKAHASDGTTFANSPISYFANSAPIQSNTLPPLVLDGQGPKVAGGAYQTAYYNTTTSRFEQLLRADGFEPVTVVTTTTNFTIPGPRAFVINCAADCTLSIPPASRYVSPESVTIKNISADGIIVTIAANSETIDGSASYLMTVQGDSLLLYPYAAGSDWKTVGSTAVVAGTTNYYPIYSSPHTLTSVGSLIQNFSGTLLFGSGVLFGTDNTYDIGGVSDNRPRIINVGTKLRLPDGSVSAPPLARSADTSTGVYFGANGVYLSNGGTLRASTDSVGLSVFNTLTVGVAGSAVGGIRLANGSTSNVVTISTGATSTPYTLIPPLAPPASTECLQMSSGGAITTTGSACGSGGGGGTNVWSDLTLPTANLALAMAGYTSTFTWGTATGAGTNLFVLKDSAVNTGTGSVLAVNTGAGSAAKPVTITASGITDGVEMTTAGVLQVLGTGGIVANALNGVSGDGIQVRTSAGNFTSRAVTASVGIGVSNGDGVAGPPTISWTPQTLVASATLWDGSQATRTLTFSLSGATDPVLTFSDGVANLSTGTLQQGGIPVVTTTGAQALTFKTITSSTNVLGGVTMGLGSDATGDTYTLVGGVLTRVPIGPVGYILTVLGGVPTWQPLPGGGGSTPVGTRVSGNYTAAIADYIVFVNATAASYTVTLYTAVGNGGRIIGVVKDDTGTNIVNVSASGTTYPISTTGGINWFESDGTNWKPYGN